MSDPNALDWSQLHILQSILLGNTSRSRISRSMRVSPEQIETQLDYLLQGNFVRRQGIFGNRYVLTVQGLNALAANGLTRNNNDAGAHQLQNRFSRNEIRHTSNVRTGFSLVFGGVLGAFVAWITISLIATVIIWSSYTLVLKDSVPAALLPYMPFDNLLIDLVISLAGSAALFLPFRRNGSLGLFGR